MTRRPLRIALLGSLLCAGPLGGAARAQNNDPHPSFVLIGVTSVPPNAAPDGSTVGGLSGLDYDPGSGSWYAISDDKSEHGSARFYPLWIDFDHGKPPLVRLQSAASLRKEPGSAFHPQGSGAEASDGESIRVVPGGHGLVWSSEGDARDGFGPAVRLMKTDGRPLTKLALPASFTFDPTEHHGPRPNLSIEGLSFTDSGRKLWLSLEAPLYQDGDLARAATGAIVRLTQVAFPSGRLLRQLAYPVEPIGAYPAGRLADNGVSEILSLDSHHMLVVERSGVQDEDRDFHFRARVYCARLDGATNVAKLASLRGQAYRPIRKTLAIDFRQFAGPRIDNVEGMALGPVLSNGHASLVFVTDNDFSARRSTQIIAVEIMARSNPGAVARALCGR